MKRVWLLSILFSHVTCLAIWLEASPEASPDPVWIIKETSLNPKPFIDQYKDSSLEEYLLRRKDKRKREGN